LLAHTEGDLWAFENEIMKLSSYKARREITAYDLDFFLRPKLRTHIFSMIDAFVEGKKIQAIQFLNNHLVSGDNENYILAMLHNQIRNIAQVQDYFDKGGRDVSEFAKVAGMHPYVVKKSAYQARKFSNIEIKNIYRKLVDIDRDIKTGKIEPRTALWNLVFYM